MTILMKRTSCSYFNSCLCINESKGDTYCSLMISATVFNIKKLHILIVSYNVMS